MSALAVGLMGSCGIARPDLWGAGEGNLPGLPDHLRARVSREQEVRGRAAPG